MVIDKALSQLLDDFLAWILLLNQLDVLSCSDLAFLDDSLLVLDYFGFMIVDEGIILANFSDDIVDLLVCSEREESFFNVEVFLFHITWHDNIIIVLVCNKQEFLDESRRGRQSDEFKYCFQAVINLSLEAQAVVLDNAEMRVSNPGIDELLIKILSLFNAFISCLIILVGKEFFGTLSSSD